MNQTLRMDEVDEDELLARTYAEPLAGLRVSWGSILAGALGIVAVSLILWALAAAITLTATSASVGSVVRSMIALGICAIVTTLIGSLVGGWLAGYLPGNRSALIGGLHGVLACALAFVLTSAAAFGVAGGIARTTTEVTTSAATATAQAAGATVGGIAGGEMALDRKAQNLLESLGYSPSESASMVREGKESIQRQLRGGGGAPAMPSARGAIGSVIDCAAGLTWSWFGTWLVSGALALVGGIIGAKRLRRRIAPRAGAVLETTAVVSTSPQPA
jgi:hypothetical protein